MQGTANDLYLACTTLDLFLVDVLPAGRKVAVTGAADLRLAGRTADILLDGRKVGTARIRAGRGVRRERRGAGPQAPRAGPLPGEGRLDGVAEAAAGAPDGRDHADPLRRQPHAARRRQPAARPEAARHRGRALPVLQASRERQGPQGAARQGRPLRDPDQGARPAPRPCSTGLARRCRSAPGKPATKRTFTLPRAADVG